jgi:hypothetical protein
MKNAFMKVVGIAGVVAALLLTGSSAMAQGDEGGAGDKVVYKKKTTIDFSDTIIEGDLMKPEGSYVVSRKASRFSALIRLRENFLPELTASPNEL